MKCTGVDYVVLYVFCSSEPVWRAGSGHIGSIISSDKVKKIKQDFAKMQRVNFILRNFSTLSKNPNILLKGKIFEKFI